MMLFSYFDATPNRDIEDELRLILLWREHHQKLGFDTKVIGEYHASRHKDYAGYRPAVEALAGPHDEARATFMRWLAMAHQFSSPGILMQYNTFLYPTVWDDLNPILHLTGRDAQKLRVYQDSRPSLVVGSEHTFYSQAERFATCKPSVTDGKVSVSDVDILWAQAKALPDSFDRFNMVKDCGEEGWQNAVVVRYPRASIPGGEARWRAIPNLRKLTVPGI